MSLKMPQFTFPKEKFWKMGLRGCAVCTSCDNITVDNPRRVYTKNIF